ncbi:hypothetical protein [Thiorhodovibrio frisius]|uniref:Uncharacterized protein n=1 Tax=Thiorhodovibrio frisius TaxID=631362 RepID=H8Z411_9GAMM|nr:hypothetical protein [Thiorhodovibrio frisius]EIC20080.1 hypothetical protein Thi970DRAFT_03693 [Thiorhodovibrio frisius]WPL20810.1 hypothetical protein Thiofri_00913 [Thiorhodovibrio frisius]
MIDCNTMRAAVLLSGALMLAGLLLGGIAMNTPLVIPASYASLILVLTASAVLAGIFIVAMIPGVSRRLEECQH